LLPAGDGPYPAWMVSPPTNREPNPLHGYVVSFVCLHERGFTAPVSWFMRGLCHHYGMELHNFTPNTILQAASFVAVCEGFLGVLANWDLWVHLFHGELHTLATGERGTRQAVRAGGLTLVLRDTRKELYPLCTMTSNNADREKGWFYLYNAALASPVHREGADGEARCLVPWCVACSAATEVGVPHHRPAPTGGRRARGGFDHRQLTTGGSSPSWRGSSASSR
jgi:hypothetical protein